MPSATPWSAAFAGAAALFSFLSVVVARLNYAEDELRRQNRIENRILNEDRRLVYSRPRKPGNLSLSSAPSVFEDTEPEYRFRVGDVLVSEKRGWRYLMNKTVHGFDGEVYVEVYVDRRANMAPGWNAGTPPDFDLIAEFDFGAHGMECETYPQESLAVVKSSSADVDRISDAMEELLDYIEGELGEELVPWED